ncbi:hypothetical protein LUI11_14685 [Bradyrhizobium diazoefficiens]|nr:hypothetical protein [Bradyrhizobium diazoefficiens]APO53339.1 hypothetical protein BD122_23725 [Bradyrhizobium diazoefficiens]MCD9295078.1 hypothetical protein [Bradyrhizobium diazoefficiens]MCD9813324.1 hypothetical protein [Bradyrhizobium diazoefficiens]MCD9829873.1 hypothetical protein [Bradyrhizobium diazoefficiens]MCD9850133.1 hypothetical protein [Bradyrhizobium diazoefficiens]
MNNVERLPEGWHMIRVEHPTPIIYTFGPEIDPYTWQSMPSTFRFFVTAKEFDRRHGQYEANKRPIIQRVEALILSGMAEPFRIAKDALGHDNLLINAETFLKIITFHSMRKNNPGGAFKARELALLFEEYTNQKNDALDWLETITPRDRARAFLTILHEMVEWKQRRGLSDER